MVFKLGATAELFASANTCIRGARLNRWALRHD
jgi:hypothetical protein